MKENKFEIEINHGRPKIEKYNLFILPNKNYQIKRFFYDKKSTIFNHSESFKNFLKNINEKGLLIFFNPIETFFIKYNRHNVLSLDLNIKYVKIEIS